MKPAARRRLDPQVLISIAMRVELRGYQKTVYWSMSKNGHDERTAKAWIQRGRELVAKLRGLGYFNNRPLAFG